MSTIFVLEIKGGKYYKVFNFLNDPFSVMGDPMNIIFGVFRETIVSLLKSIISQFFLKIEHVKCQKLLKTRGLLTKRQAILGLSNCMCLIELYKCSLEWSWLSLWYLLFFEILCSVFFMRNSLNANNCWRRQNFENCSTWPNVHLWWIFRICCYFCVKLNILGCKKCIQFHIKWVLSKTRLCNNA